MLGSYKVRAKLVDGALVQEVAVVDGSGNQISVFGESSYVTRVDEASATITYIGEADPGTATSAASWRVKRVDTSSGTVILYAGSVTSFNQIWDNRAGLTYG